MRTMDHRKVMLNLGYRKWSRGDSKVLWFADKIRHCNICCNFYRGCVKPFFELWFAAILKSRYFNILAKRRGFEFRCSPFFV
jgi:hypothetical protein